MKMFVGATLAAAMLIGSTFSWAAPPKVCLLYCPYYCDLTFTDDGACTCKCTAESTNKAGKPDKVKTLRLQTGKNEITTYGEPFTLVVVSNTGPEYSPTVVIRVDYADGRSSDTFSTKGPDLQTAKRLARLGAEERINNEPPPEPKPKPEPEPKPKPEPKPAPEPEPEPEPKPKPSCNPKLMQCPEP